MLLKSLIRTHLLQMGLHSLFEGLLRNFKKLPMEEPYKGSIHVGMRFRKAEWRASEKLRKHLNGLQINYDNVEITYVEINEQTNIPSVGYRYYDSEFEDFVEEEDFLDRMTFYL